jgi:L-2-hydroxycarboxylate dehydrogenase (NAD+)
VQDEEDDMEAGSDGGARIARNELERICSATFSLLGLAGEEARIASEVLVAADAMGIPLHGVGRLPRYVEGLRTGLMRPEAASEIVSEGPSSIVVNAHGAMGAPASFRVMRSVIAKAASAGPPSAASVTRTTSASRVTT